MAQLSEFASMVKKIQGRGGQPGKPGVRGSASAPALPGFTRGSMGSMGSKLLTSRNSDAGAQKEMKYLNSPIFKSFVSKLTPHTPVTDYLRTNGS